MGSFKLAKVDEAVSLQGEQEVDVFDASLPNVVELARTAETQRKIDALELNVDVSEGAVLIEGVSSDHYAGGHLKIPGVTMVPQSEFAPVGANEQFHIYNCTFDDSGETFQMVYNPRRDTLELLGDGVESVVPDLIDGMYLNNRMTNPDRFLGQE